MMFKVLLRTFRICSFEHFSGICSENDDRLHLNCSPPGGTRPVSPLSVEVGSFRCLGLFLIFLDC